MKNVETIFLETVRQSASCLLDVDCLKAFNARNIIDDVIWRAREMHCALNLSSWWWNWGWLVNVRTYRTALCRQMFFQAELTLFSTVLAQVRGTQVPLAHLSDSNTHYIITTRSRASSEKRAHQCVSRTNHTPSKRRTLTRQHKTDMHGGPFAALSPAPNCVFFTMLSMKSRVTTATNTTSWAPHTVWKSLKVMMNSASSTSSSSSSTRGGGGGHSLIWAM